MESFDLPFNSFLCPIGQTIMRDPVVTVDGHSYERRQIETWFASQAAPTSPVTAQLLPSKTLISNHALRSAIDAYYETLPPHAQAQIDKEAAEVPMITSLTAKNTPLEAAPMSIATASGVDVPYAGSWSWASAPYHAELVEVTGNGQVLRRKQEGGQFTDVAAFASRPLRLFPDEPMVFAVKIVKVSYAWRGLFLGVAPELDPSCTIGMHLERRGWYLDGERWFRSPNDDHNQLVSLNTAKLNNGDVIGLQVCDNGSISFFVNGKTVVQIDAGVDVRDPLVPWVALMGNCEEVSLAVQTPNEAS